VCVAVGGLGHTTPHGAAYALGATAVQKGALDIYMCMHRERYYYIDRWIDRWKGCYTAVRGLVNTATHGALRTPSALPQCKKVR